MEFGVQFQGLGCLGEGRRFVWFAYSQTLSQTLSFPHGRHGLLHGVVTVFVFVSLPLSPRSLMSFGGSRCLQRRWVTGLHISFWGLRAVGLKGHVLCVLGDLLWVWAVLSCWGIGVGVGIVA